MSPSVCSPCLRGHHTACTLGDRCPCRACNPAPKAEPDGIVWEDPPLKGASTCAIPLDVTTELRKHPGRWARVKTYQSKSGANGLKAMFSKGRLPTIPDPDKWECTARVTKTGSALYLRFVGDGPAGS